MDKEDRNGWARQVLYVSLIVIAVVWSSKRFHPVVCACDCCVGFVVVVFVFRFLFVLFGFFSSSEL